MINLVDATSLLQDINSGLTTPKQLVLDAITKIESTNQRLNTTAEILRTDAEIQLNHLPTGELSGLPISIKECYAIKGKTIRSGSMRMKPINCKEDSEVVKKLKNAGAVIVARGNTSEFLLGRETDNLIYGTTNNCINPALTAGGSSGGDASLVGSHCVSFGIGTDLGGSCRYPAAFNGIVGFKPASGQIDKTGIFPKAENEFIESMNSPGILTRSVRDARLVYNVLGDKHLNSNTDISNANFFSSNNFKVKIKDESISKALNESINFLKTKTASYEDMDIPESGSLMTDWNLLIFGGFTDKIYEWSVTENGSKLSFIKELFNRLLKKQTISNEIFSILLPFNMLKPSTSKLEKLITKVQDLRTKYYSQLGSNGVLILPTLGSLAPEHNKFRTEINKPGVIEIITPISFCNVLNLSSITIPVWKYQKDKLSSPPAIQLITKPGNEELLLNTAESLESHFQQ
ncbi:MAG: amidase [Bacteroidetes bacterium]|nr:amidase [Bacteroidota bacterium]